MFPFIRSRGGKLVRAFRALALPILYHGQARWCPVCEKGSRKFLDFGDPKRSDARCPCCGSLERHRLAWLYLLRMTNLFNGEQKKMLHVAPEPCLSSRLQRRLGDGYLSADLLSRRAMVQMDVTDIQFPDRHFDVIFCSHVLEHIVDDRQAMREFFRVLKPGGWALLLVPVTAERTMEDPAIEKPEERRQAFGQEDHVRRYGPDYVERLRAAGFMVKTSRSDDFCHDGEIARLGLPAARGEIYCCFRPQPGVSACISREAGKPADG